MQNKFKIDLHILFPFVITLILWMVFYFDTTQHWHLHEYGVWPLQLKGIPGILGHFFIHGNFSHILSNTISFLVLSLLLFVSYREIAFKVFALMLPLTGLGIWLIGRGFEHGIAICHIGASGVIFSLFGFLLLSGLIRKNKRLMALTALVIFLYGYMVWGIFPTETQVSWEGHLSGLFSGLILAYVFKQKGPEADKYEIHDDEEEEDENNLLEEEKYWMQDAEELTPKEEVKEKNDTLFINYDFLPKNNENDDKKNQ